MEELELCAYPNVVIIYVASANIAANNRGQTVTARKDETSGWAIAGKEEGGRKDENEDEAHMNRRLKRARILTRDDHPFKFNPFAPLV